MVAVRWQDCTTGEANTLTLYFRGEANNGSGYPYVAIEGSAGEIAEMTHLAADAVRATECQKSHISLADLQASAAGGASVKKMIIGVGNLDIAEPCGEGRLYIDDITLTNRMP
jgi:hypothetical protein